MNVNVELVKQKVMDFDLKEALQLLANSLSNTEFEDQILLLNQRYSRAQKEQTAGTISDDDFDTEMNKITLSISNFLKELKSDFISKTLVFAKEMMFYQTDSDKLPEFKDRKYTKTFKHGETSLIAWELRSSCPAVKNPVSIPLTWRVLKPDGGWSPVYPSVLTIQEGWTGNWFARTYGYRNGTKMDAGAYTVEVVVNEEITIKSSFEIL